MLRQSSKTFEPAVWPCDAAEWVGWLPVSMRAVGSGPAPDEEPDDISTASSRGKMQWNGALRVFLGNGRAMCDKESRDVCSFPFNCLPQRCELIIPVYRAFHFCVSACVWRWRMIEREQPTIACSGGICRERLSGARFASAPASRSR